MSRHRKTVPSWAASMIQNYRRAFHQKHGRPTTLDDEQIMWICDNVHDDADTEKQDEARVEAMLEEEDKDGEEH